MTIKRPFARMTNMRSIPAAYVVAALLASCPCACTRDGSLRIGTFDGLARWPGGALIHYEELAGQRILSLTEDRNGTVWAGGLRPAGANLCEIRDRTAACVGRDGTFDPGCAQSAKIQAVVSGSSPD